MCGLCIFRMTNIPLRFIVENCLYFAANQTLDLSSYPVTAIKHTWHDMQSIAMFWVETSNSPTHYNLKYKSEGVVECAIRMLSQPFNL